MRMTPMNCFHKTREKEGQGMTPSTWVRRPSAEMGRAVRTAALLVGLLAPACQDSPLPSPTPTAQPDTGLPDCAPDWDGDTYLANPFECIDEDGTVRSPAVPQVNQDCDIYDASFHPGAEERYDGKDNDCNGQIDDDSWYTDDDGDGFSELAGDCNDFLANIYPGQVEVPGDQVDSNCDGYDGKIAPDTSIDDPTTYADTALEKASAILVGPADRANLMGWSSSIGDLDGDGQADLAWATAVSSRDTLETEGVVYVAYVPRAGYSGTLEYDQVASFTLHGVGAPNSLGITMRSGDLNGDGTADLIVGDHLQRAIYVFFGGPRRSGSISVTEADVSFHGVGDDSAPIGHVFDCPGDLNQDGYDELVIGQPDFDYSRGRAFIYYGRPSWSTHTTLSEADTTLEGHQNLELGGMVVQGLGDLDEDGYPDLGIISAWEVQAEINDLPDYIENPAGSVHLYYGGAAHIASGLLKDTAHAHLVTTDAYSFLLGMTLNSADLDLDGHLELIMGIPAAWAEVFYGTGERLSARVPLIDLFDSTFELSGYTVSIGEFVAVADLMDDDAPEVVLSANVRGYDGMLAPGQVSVFWGQTSRPELQASNQNPAVSSTLYGAFGLLELVFQVSARGDLTGDERPDLLVSTQLYPYQQARSALVIFTGGNIR